MPRHVNFKQDYANTITVHSPLVVEATTVDKTFTVQLLAVSHRSIVGWRMLDLVRSQAPHGGSRSTSSTASHFTQCRET
jgi:hypothetical protein